MCRSALRGDAARTGLLSATGPIRLLQERARQTGLLLVQPISPTATVTSRESVRGHLPGDALNQVPGFVIAAVRLGALLERVLEHSTAPWEAATVTWHEVVGHGLGLALALWSAGGASIVYTRREWREVWAHCLSMH